MRMWYACKIALSMLSITILVKNNSIYMMKRGATILTHQQLLVMSTRIGMLVAPGVSLTAIREETLDKVEASTYQAWPTLCLLIARLTTSLLLLLLLLLLLI